MKTIKFFAISFLVLISFVCTAQCRLGITFEELKSEFPEKEYPVQDFGKNGNWGYHFIVAFSDSKIVFILNKDSICVENLYIPYSEEDYLTFKKRYDEKYNKINNTTWLMDTEYENTYVIISEITDAESPIVKKYKRYFKANYYTKTK